MAGLSTGQDQGLRQARAQYRGAVGSEPLKSLLEALKRLLGNEVQLPDVKTKSFVAKSNAEGLVLTGACTLYGVRVESGNALTSTRGVVVALYDDTVLRAATSCSSEQASEAYFFGGTRGVGIPIVTALNVKALAEVDAAADPAAGDKPIVTVFYGDS
jgi:hypothetical protein